MRALDNWKKSFIVRKMLEKVSMMLRQRHGNNTKTTRKRHETIRGIYRYDFGAVYASNGQFKEGL